jgi:hypothetical protein
MSVHRADRSPPKPPAGKAFALVVAGRIRRDVTNVAVEPDEPPPDHALLRYTSPAQPDARPEHSDHVRADEEAWKAFYSVCTKLAEIASPP